MIPTFNGQCLNLLREEHPLLDRGAPPGLVNTETGMFLRQEPTLGSKFRGLCLILRKLTLIVTTPVHVIGICLINS